jgi:hypothetical protein
MVVGEPGLVEESADEAGTVLDAVQLVADGVGEFVDGARRWG